MATDIYPSLGVPGATAMDKPC